MTSARAAASAGCQPSLRRSFAVALGCVVAAVSTPAAERPNIILILADDLGYGDVGFHGSTQIPTPHLDRLAASGVHLAEGYVSAPVCSPSRAGLLTGRNQVEFGYDNNLDHNQPGFDPAFNGLPVTERTIADRLRAVGFRTGLIGKWHLGDQPQFHPTRRGFDEFWGFLGGGHSYFPTVPAGQTEPRLESNVGPVGPITYLTDDITDQGIAFIERHRDRPFFLCAAYNAPHTPMHAREEDLARFAFIPDRQRRTYCAMVARLDHAVGRLLDAVRESGLENKTLIVFLSDNGGPVDQNSSLNAPLNGQKGILLEGGLRVPFVFSLPGRLPAGKVYLHAVTSLDLAPTFLRLAGVPAEGSSGLPGVDLWPHLTGSVDAPPHEQLRWRFTVSAALREGDWKLVRLPDRLPLLFNLRADVAEQHDVAMGNLERTRDMLRRLGDWDVRLPHPVMLEGAVWKRRQLNLYDAQYPLQQPVGGEAPRIISSKVTNEAERPAPPGYRLVWCDEFERDGAPDPAKWGFESGFVRNQELQWYQPENARCERGLLVIEARRESKPNLRHQSVSRDWRLARATADYTSASVTTRGRHAWLYGRIEVRARIDVRAGLWPAIWTLGVEGRWPANGEIDVMEYYRGLVLANTFWAQAGRKGPAGVVVRQPLGEFFGPHWADTFHVWRLDREAEEIRIYVDDVLLNRTAVVESQRLEPGQPHPFRQPHFLLLNLAVGGQGGDPSSAEFPARFEVDYVRVYERVL